MLDKGAAQLFAVPTGIVSDNRNSTQGNRIKTKIKDEKKPGPSGPAFMKAKSE